MTNEKINEMWTKLNETNLTGKRAATILKKFMTKEENKAYTKESLEYMKAHPECLESPRKFDKAMNAILLKYVESRKFADAKKLMAKIATFVERMVADNEIEMPEIVFDATSCKANKKQIKLAAIELLYKVNKDEEAIYKSICNWFVEVFGKFYGKEITADVDAIWNEEEKKEEKKGVKTIKKTTKKETKKETFTWEAAEKFYNEIHKTAKALVKCKLVPSEFCEKVIAEELRCMTEKFDIPEYKAKEFLDKMENKERTRIELVNPKIVSVKDDGITVSVDGIIQNGKKYCGVATVITGEFIAIAVTKDKYIFDKELNKVALNYAVGRFAFYKGIESVANGLGRKVSEIEDIYEQMRDIDGGEKMWDLRIENNMETLINMSSMLDCMDELSAAVE